jgi:hypothetical protein
MNNTQHFLITPDTNHETIAWIEQHIDFPKWTYGTWLTPGGRKLISGVYLTAEDAIAFKLRFEL